MCGLEAYREVASVILAGNLRTRSDLEAEVLCGNLKRAC